MKRNWMVVYYQNGVGTCLEWYQTEKDAEAAAAKLIEQEKTSTAYVGKNVTIISRSVQKTKVEAND